MLLLLRFHVPAADPSSTTASRVLAVTAPQDIAHLARETRMRGTRMLLLLPMLTWHHPEPAKSQSLKPLYPARDVSRQRATRACWTRQPHLSRA